MWEAMTEIFASGDIWTIIIKVLVTAIVGGIVSLLGTILGKLISKHKESKIYKYAETLVEAAEQKFPNEGTKMGPEKMDYVMSQIVIRFPKIKDNTYFYNIVEQTVYKLNEEKRKAQLIADFEEKYGEKPIGYEEDTYEDVKTDDSQINESSQKEEVEEENKEKLVSATSTAEPAKKEIKKEIKKINIQSF